MATASSSDAPIADDSKPAWTQPAGIAVLGAIAAGLSVLITQNPKLGILATVAIPGSALLLRSGASAAFFVFLVVLNIPAVAANFHGVPKTVAAGIIGFLLVPVFRKVVLEKQSLRFPRITIVMALFQLIQFPGVLVAIRPDTSVSYAVTSLFEGFLMFLLFVNAVRTESELRICVIGAFLAGAFMSLPTIHQSMKKAYFRNYGGFAQMGDQEHLAEHFEQGKSLRHAGPLGEKNRFAQVLLLAAPFVLAFFAPGQRKWLPVALVMLLLTLVAFTLTRSRGGVLAIGSMLIALTIVRRIPIRHLVMLALFAAPGVALLGADYLDRVGSIVDVAINASSGSVRNSDSAVRGRLNEMGAAVLVFLDHPVTGVGPAMFQYHYRDYAGLIGLHVHNEDRKAHCTYLQIAAENGIFGLILFLVICSRTFTALWRSIRTTECERLSWLLTAVFVSYVGYLTGSILLSFTFVRYFWLILAISWVAIDLAEASNRKPITTQATT
ncbi:MAG: O-antigen ligase family protein [Planctomycetaceae bacterium]